MGIGDRQNQTEGCHQEEEEYEKDDDWFGMTGIW